METRSSGMSLGGVLLVIFIVLKLVGAISWSWIWVLSPLWISFAIIGVFYIFAGIISAINTPSNNFKCVDKNAKWDDDWYLKMNGNDK